MMWTSYPTTLFVGFLYYVSSFRFLLIYRIINLICSVFNLRKITIKTQFLLVMKENYDVIYIKTYYFLSFRLFK